MTADTAVLSLCMLPQHVPGEFIMVWWRGCTRGLVTNDSHYCLWDACPADFVTLHVPGSEETFNMIGREQIAMMKPGSFLLNLSRGNVVCPALMGMYGCLHSAKACWCAG